MSTDTDTERDPDQITLALSTIIAAFIGYVVVHEKNIEHFPDPLSRWDQWRELLHAVYNEMREYQRTFRNLADPGLGRRRPSDTAIEFLSHGIKPHGLSIHGRWYFSGEPALARGWASEMDTEILKKMYQIALDLPEFFEKPLAVIKTLETLPKIEGGE